MQIRVYIRPKCENKDAGYTNGYYSERASIQGIWTKSFAGRSLCLSVGSLRGRGYVLALQVVLNLTNLLATLDPPFAVSLAALISQLVQSGPVGRVIIFELNIASNRLQQLTGRNMLPQILVELELLTSQWVDKRCDHFEETPDQERNYVRSELALGKNSKKVF